MSRLPFEVLIPARLASTRLPNKPLLDLGGLPMIVRVAQQVSQSGAARVTVATDHASIASVCQAHGVSVVMTRQDHLSGSDRLAEACEQLGLPEDAVVVNVQGDEPLMDPNLVKACADALAADTEAVMSTAAHPVQAHHEWHNPNVVKVVMDRLGRALYFSRAPVPFWRDAPATGTDLPLPSPGFVGVMRHVGIYAYRVRYLKAFPQLSPAPMERIESLEQLRVLWHGGKIAVHVTDKSPGMGVDTPEDLERARKLWTTRADPAVS